MLIYMMMIDSQEEQSKFEKIYKEYRGVMFYVANQILNNEHDAEDAVHQAFVKIAENIEKIKQPVCPKTKGFVVTIVENKAIDVYRKKNRHPVTELQEEITGIEVQYSGKNGLARCILRLTPKYRECILLKYHYGYSTKEIAQILGISESNAIKLDQRAKKKLRQLCEEEGML